MKPKDLNERQTAFVLALARLISDENSEREFAAMDNSTEFAILMDIATKLPADSEEFQLTTGLCQARDKSAPVARIKSAPLVS